MALYLATLALYVSAQPSFANIKQILYGGSGCPQGSSSAYITPDRSAFHVEFAHLTAISGNGTHITDSRKNCQISVEFEYEAGWQFSLAGVGFTGSVNLQPDVTAVEKTSYYFQGESDTADFQHVFNGPDHEDFNLVDIVPLNPPVWSGCTNDVGLEINTRVQILNSTTTGPISYITTNSETGIEKREPIAILVHKRSKREADALYFKREAYPEPKATGEIVIKRTKRTIIRDKRNALPEPAIEKREADHGRFH
ncbi:hypothetical protein HDV06_007007 [Boothiomyces sp. JEL0866]|nr:hypothetical protein HDV06_007007 [Boothiomyces sp. JEL0866]